MDQKRVLKEDTDKKRRMKKGKPLKDSLITSGFLCCAFFISLLFHHIFKVQEHITTIFVFTVFLISMFTEGYFYGILSSFLGTLAVNYAFTFPYFVINFRIPINFISGIIMTAISILTSALITKLKKHEAIQIEGERERMRANLLRAVSHDLRTPLTTIYASSTALLENSKGMTREQKKKLLEGIKEDAQWLVRMVENLLSITKIDTGQVKITKTPVVLEELIDSVILKFKKRYPNQMINLKLPEEVIIIPMDAILIEQVLINLLENAVQHAKGMTKLILKVWEEENHAVFEIKDNGCGILTESLDTIFSGRKIMEYETADSKKKNAGIGLSVCATIIKAHGGNITGKNRKSKGAVFRFTLDTERIHNDTE